MNDITTQNVHWGNWMIEPDGTATYNERGPVPMEDATIGGLIRDVESRIQIEAHVPGKTVNPSAERLPEGYPMQHLLDLLRQRYPDNMDL